YVTQSPDSCGNPPVAAGLTETAFSSINLSKSPVTVVVMTWSPKGTAARISPAVIGYGGGIDGSHTALPAPGQVSELRSEPELVIAKSTPYALRIASATTSPISDSHVRPPGSPHESARGIESV